MEDEVKTEVLTRGQKISAALKNKKWSVERKEAFKKTMNEGKELRKTHLLSCNLTDHSNCRDAGFLVGRPVVKKVTP